MKIFLFRRFPFESEHTNLFRQTGFLKINFFTLFVHLRKAIKNRLIEDQAVKGKYSKFILAFYSNGVIPGMAMGRTGSFISHSR